MSNDLPNCTCGANCWSGGGFQLGPSYQFYARLCDACGKVLQYVGRDGWWVTLIAPVGNEKALLDYINGSMVVQARAYKEQWEAAATAKEKVEYDALVTQWGLDPLKGCIHHYLHDVPQDAKGCTTFEYRDHEGNRLDIDATAFRAACRELWDANPRYPSIVRAPDPINLPEGVTAFVLRPPYWDRVDPQTTQGQELPEDPLRRGHNECFRNIFTAVKQASNCTFFPREIQNRYYGDTTNSQPWYEFEVAGAKFVVGPRKRVINIEARFPGPRPIVTLRDQAKADGVTYQAEGTYQGMASEATCITVHAWGQEKAVEYLTAAVQAAMSKVG